MNKKMLVAHGQIFPTHVGVNCMHGTPIPDWERCTDK